MLPATALAEPAVSGPNGKISIEGGSISDNGAFLGLGSYTIPLGTNYGMQFDGALGSISSHFLGGGGVHLFTRDPSKYLLGVYGSYHTWNDINIWRTAGEAELYRDRFSLSGLAGVEGINGTAADNSHFFGLFDFAYYPMDDLKLSAGFDYVNETGMGTAGVEYLMHHGTTPISLFAKGRFGASDYQSITAGVRVHFGADPNATLIARNRTADPDNYVPVFPAVSGPNVCQVSTGESDVHVYNSETACTCPNSYGWYPFGDGHICRSTQR